MPLTELQIAELEIRGLTNSLAICNAELAATTAVFSTLAEKYQLLLAHVKAGGSDVVVVEKTRVGYQPTSINYIQRAKGFVEQTVDEDGGKTPGHGSSPKGTNDSVKPESESDGGRSGFRIKNSSEVSQGIAGGSGEGSESESRESSSEGSLYYEARVQEAVKLAEELLYLLTH